MQFACSMSDRISRYGEPGRKKSCECGDYLMNCVRHPAKVPSTDVDVAIGSAGGEMTMRHLQGVARSRARRSHNEGDLIEARWFSNLRVLAPRDLAKAQRSRDPIA